jgi:hypothetical protein
MTSLLLFVVLGVGGPTPKVDRAPKDRPDAGVVVKKKEKKQDRGSRAEEE